MSIYSENLKSKIISIEGIDSVGKNTQANLLKNYISENFNECVLYSFPRYNTPTGKSIKEMLSSNNSIDILDKITLFSDDRLASKESILFDLQLGKTVILDRYVTSMKVYASAEVKLNEQLNYSIPYSPLNQDH